MEAIRTVGLTKVYGTRRVVDNLSLTVRRGEVYGFVGRNGAGKSTFMKMLYGLVMPTEGRVEVFGEQQLPGTASRRMGAVIEHPGVHPNLTALDNVRYRAIALGVPASKEASLDALTLVGLGDVAHRRVRTLSLGMKQRVGLAQALVGSPDLLLLDEPFNGLDPQGVRDVRTLVARLVETRGITAFISSHVIDQLERMVARYGVIRDGRLVREVTAEEVARECAECLRVRCANPQLALSVLEDAFPQARFTVHADDVLEAQGDLAGEELGSALAAAGIAVFELAVHARDIEEYFVNLMGADAAAGREAKGGAYHAA